MSSHILWQNSDQTITLIDIPRSIAVAQGDGNTTTSRLLSSPPLQAPFPSTEPKSAAVRAKLRANAGDGELQDRYRELIQSAIEEVRARFEGEWCLPRPFVEGASATTKKRRRSGSQSDTQHENGDAGPSDTFVTDLAYGRDTCTHSNSTQSSTMLDLHNPRTTETHPFLLPPKSSFYLSSCANATAFRAAVRAQAQQTNTRSKFDLILLDPPWPNRSVRRTYKTAGSTYATPASLSDIQALILGSDLDMLMEERCVVGMWITNKPSIRQLVLDEGGVFDSWGLEVVEEWIWVKTTVTGEPVTALEGVWRRPYEVLLVGRRGARGDAEAVGAEAVKRRVVFGVPDLHSRKPCLKALMQPLMPAPGDYRALEVFARYLVAGWWSWGDECVKFNWEGHWQKNTGEG